MDPDVAVATHAATTPPADRGPRRFDQFDLRALFASARSAAVVGNAATILEYHNGPLIDGHDLVVRFNRAQTKGLEDRIGSRTDLLVANELNALDIAPSPAETLRPRAVLSFVLAGPTFDVGPLRAWVGDDIPLLCAFPPDVIGFEQAGRTRLLTHGTYALYVLLGLLQLERLFVTGFNMFGAGKGGGHKYYGPAKSVQGTYHDLDLEARLFCEILASFQGELRVTEEVASLLERHGHGRLARGERPPGGGLPTLTLADRARARLAWWFLRWGTKLRRAVEKTAKAEFDDIIR
jgi:hypothetical protein